MAEKTGSKQVAITISRQSRPDAKVVQVTGFKLRQDKATGVVEILFERKGAKGERVSFDPVIVRTNLVPLKEYVAGMACVEDDDALKDEVAVSDPDSYSNVVHLCQMEGRAETVFSLFRFAEWVEATRQDGKTREREVKSVDVVIAISTSGLQKKLVLELLSLLN